MQEFTDRRENGGDRLVVVLELVLQLAELLSQGLVRGEQIAQLYESAHDIDPHGDGPRGVENVGSLDRTVLGEGPRQFAAAPVTRS
jgi:hypothetical protein